MVVLNTTSNYYESCPEVCVCVCHACTSSYACNSVKMHACIVVVCMHCWYSIDSACGRFSNLLFKGEGSLRYALKCWVGDLLTEGRSTNDREASLPTGSERERERTPWCVCLAWHSRWLGKQEWREGGCFKDCSLITGSIWTVTHTLQGERERAGKLCSLCCNYVSLMFLSFYPWVWVNILLPCM